MRIGARLLAGARRGVDPRLVEEARGGGRRSAARGRAKLSSTMSRASVPAVAARRRRWSAARCGPSGRAAPCPSPWPSARSSDARGAGSWPPPPPPAPPPPRRRPRWRRGGAAAGRRIAPPAVLDLLLERQGVEAEREGRTSCAASARGQALGGGAAAGRVGVRQPVQRLGQRQASRGRRAPAAWPGSRRRAAPSWRPPGARSSSSRSRSWRQLVRTGEAHAPQPRPPARAPPDAASSAASISASSSAFSSSVKNRLSAAICEARARMSASNLRPGRIVAGGRGRQRRVGADAPELVGRALVEADALVDQRAELAPASAARADEGALQRRQLAR